MQSIKTRQLLGWRASRPANFSPNSRTRMLLLLTPNEVLKRTHTPPDTAIYPEKKRTRKPARGGCGEGTCVLQVRK